MAQTGWRDAPDLPDFSLLKRLARDQLIYLLEQVSPLCFCATDYQLNTHGTDIQLLIQCVSIPFNIWIFLQKTTVLLVHFHAL